MASDPRRHRHDLPRQRPAARRCGRPGVVDWFSMAHLDELRRRRPPERAGPARGRSGRPGRVHRVERAAVQHGARQRRRPGDHDVVRTIRAARPSLGTSVLLGNDTALPFARLDDLTTIANEADYASTFSRSDDLYGALFEHRVLSDDPYATTDPIPYLQRQLFVPQLAVGPACRVGPQITGRARPLPRLRRRARPDERTDERLRLPAGRGERRRGRLRRASSAHAAGHHPAADRRPLDARARSPAALGTTTGLAGLNGHADHHRAAAREPARDLFTAADLPGLARARGRVQHGLPLGAVGERRLRGGRDRGRLGAGVRGQGRGGLRRQPRLRLRRHDHGRVLGGAERPARRGAARRPADRRGARRGEAGATSPTSGSSASTTRRRCPSSPSTACPCGRCSAPTARGGEAATRRLRAAGRRHRLSTDTDPVTGLVVDRYRSQPTLTPQTDDPFGSRLDGPERHAGRRTCGRCSRRCSSTSPTTRTACSSPPGVERRVVDQPGVRTADRRQLGRGARAAVRRRRLPGQDPDARLAADAHRAPGLRGARARPVLLGRHRRREREGRASGSSRASTSRPALGGDRPAGAAPRRIEATVLSGASQVSFSVDAVDLPAATAVGVTRVLVAFRDETSPTWRFLDLQRESGRHVGRRRAGQQRRGSSTSSRRSTLPGTSPSRPTRGSCSKALRLRRRAGPASSPRSTAHRRPAGSHPKRCSTSRRPTAWPWTCRSTAAPSRRSRRR